MISGSFSRAVRNTVSVEMTMLHDDEGDNGDDDDDDVA